MSKYVAGAWNAICQRCGFEKKSFMLRQEWTGLRVCAECWESRHPQDLIRVPREDVSIPWSSPEPAEVFISPGYPLSIESSEISWLLTETGIIINTEG